MSDQKHSRAKALTDTLRMAAINCPHEIESDRVTLHFDAKQPGHNALNQLWTRIANAITESVEQHEAEPAEILSSAARAFYARHEARMGRSGPQKTAAQPEPAVADGRAAFEAFVSEKTSLAATCNVYGFYVDPTVYEWWKVWQAARASSPNAAGDVSATLLSIGAMLRDAGYSPDARILDAVREVIAKARASNAAGAEGMTYLNERATLAAGQWANSNTPIKEALAYRDGFIAGAGVPPPAPESAPVGLTDALRRAREELSNVEWENDPPARITDLFSTIDAILDGDKR